MVLQRHALQSYAVMLRRWLEICHFSAGLVPPERQIALTFAQVNFRVVVILLKDRT